MYVKYVITRQDSANKNALVGKLMPGGHVRVHVIEIMIVKQ